MVACVAPELDDRFARAYATFNGHPERTRPTVGALLDWLAIGDGERARALECLVGDRPLHRLGIVELEGAGPLATRVLRPAPELPSHLLGVSPGTRPRIEGFALDTLDRLVIGEALRDRTIELARTFATRTPLVIVHGPTGAGRHAYATALAHALGHAALAITLDELATLGLAALERWARWENAALVLEDPGETVIPAALARVAVPQIWVRSKPGIEHLPIGARELALVGLDEPDRALRAGIWRSTLGAGSEVDIDTISRRYRLGAGAIIKAAAAARSDAWARGRSISLEDVGAACRAVPSTELDALAQRLPCEYRLSDLVIGDATRRELELALAWVRHDQIVFETWQMASRMPLGRGLACLFSGPSGTGKTMAAQILARELGLQLFRVDLSRVVSKYIGETEKNLERVFANARSANAMLLFDEADALFGKRTEVHDARDRYANIETGYLLQRIETHDGVTVLTTNLRKNIDDAFQRRMHVVADFALPGVGERARLWLQNLPALPHRADDIDVAFLAERFELSGGIIRNAAVAASVLAAAAGTRVDMECVLIAAVREQMRAGRLIDPSHLGPWESKVRGKLGLVPERGRRGVQ